MSYCLLYLISIVLLVIVVKCQASDQRALVLNALGTNSTDSAEAIFQLITIIDSLKNRTSGLLTNLLHKVAFVRKEGYDLIPDTLKLRLEKSHDIKIHFFKSNPLKDRGIGRYVKIKEHVTAILESLEATTSDKQISSLVALSLTSTSKPIPTSHFEKLFQMIGAAGSSYQVLLKGKNRRLSSISDWHDLQVVGLSPAHPLTSSWLRTLKETYLAHADRIAFTMLEPRPAIFEANIVHRKDIRIGYLDYEHICVFPWDNAEHAHQHAHDHEPFDARYYHKHQLESIHDRRCQATEERADILIEMECGDGKLSDDHNCAVVGDPVAWKTSIGEGRSIEEKIGMPKDQWRERLPDAMNNGIVRFRNAKDANTPGDMCWDSGDDTEKGPSSLIYDDFLHSRTYKPPPSDPNKKKRTVLMFTGALGSWSNLDTILYPTLSKVYYAHRHRYRFHLQLSNQMVHYYPDDLFAAVNRPDAYFKGVMSKTIMTLDAMHLYPEYEWLMFTDDDVYINAEWLDTPLDAFLEDVSDDKLWVHTNYRSTLSGIFFVRNNAAGRKLVRDWVAIGMSGQVSCHGFDQAALQVLVALRQSDTFMERPFNFSCLSNDLGGSGCSGSDWSCDYKFEKLMMKLGFRVHSNNAYFSDSFSSYSRGCANNYIRDFHVTFETAFRPRLQCFHCGRIDSIEAQTWDGPLGGANERIRAGALDAWFTNHKVNWLFYQQYIDPHACKRANKEQHFLENCDEEMSSLHEASDSIVNELEREKFYSEKGRKLISLVDGYALNLETGGFCRVNEKLASSQRARTYMKDYASVIEAAKSYSEADWKQKMRTMGEGEARGGKCHPTLSEAECPDGLNWRKKDSNWFLASKDVCSACNAVPNLILDPTGKRLAMSCEQDINFETPNPAEKQK